MNLFWSFPNRCSHVLPGVSVPLIGLWVLTQLQEHRWNSVMSAGERKRKKNRCNLFQDFLFKSSLFVHTHLMGISHTICLCFIYNNRYWHGHLSVTCRHAFGGADKCDIDQFGGVGLHQWFTQLAYCIAGRLQRRKINIPIKLQKKRCFYLIEDT